MIKDYKVKITENRFISGITWLLKFKNKEIAEKAKPAHFIMVRPTAEYQYDPMMRRAFAIADVVDDEIWIYYDVYGRGTKALTEKKVGDEIEILAPLGKNLFPEKFDYYILVGGGIGFAGLSYLMKKLRNENKPFKAIYGVRRKQQLSMLDWIKENGFENDVIIYTEDGSYGEKGLVIRDLKELALENKNTVIFTCGPHGMMKAVDKIAKEINIPCYASLESKMACGFGICIGCVIKDVEKNSYVRVCYEGPVFDTYKIEL
ncbi:dihydroorotate dehydrogenase electron transfer subunit [Hydrogenivirga sp. 128-5-R1-1]|uniref:dihydroorotate dehydrogenase electron transfer subunit n=1 Tax=Hydrogenivirga sp. 128-5-R1-1 TaxID=392423 RepID=UPI00015F02D7|nr:dihydroorotate dehydrogenase electron transfer subunit [Hydrogenivirga sp. 128-5-R1-1]EDP74206.1 dihydroorotate dehydrogenase electron transfer subunit [Hydrogenivirga sp. 128-5-R1-1]